MTQSRIALSCAINSYIRDKEHYILCVRTGAAVYMCVGTSHPTIVGNVIKGDFESLSHASVTLDTIYIPEVNFVKVVNAVNGDVIYKSNLLQTDSDGPFKSIPRST